MKHLIYIITILLLGTTALHAQEKPQKDNEGVQQQEQKAGQAEARSGFVDEDGDGINDNRQQGNSEERSGNQQKTRERRRDHFIDVDGDGINDDRCSGVGVRSGQRRGQQKGGNQ